MLITGNELQARVAYRALDRTEWRWKRRITERCVCVRMSRSLKTRLWCR